MNTRLKIPAPVRRSALPGDTIDLARWLVGRLLVRTVENDVLMGRIVETEAYLPGDEASHAFRGPTPRNRSMYLRKGHAYVYFIYGRYFMLNVSSGDAGYGAAVLIRALAPVAGLERMYRARNNARLTALARGPGCLAAALEIDRALDGVDLCRRGPLWIADDGAAPPAIAASVRIGITRNIEPLWRFSATDKSLTAYVSGPRPQK